MSDYLDRLQKYLAERQQPLDFESLTADASIREYFRITWNGRSAVACVYPQGFDPADQSFLDLTRLFTAAGLPVAEVLDFDGNFGVIVQEDLGNRILREVMLESDEEPDPILTGDFRS